MERSFSVPLLFANLWTKAPTYVRIGPFMRGKLVWHHPGDLVLSVKNNDTDDQADVVTTTSRFCHSRRLY
jgi:hypothetical protein